MENVRFIIGCDLSKKSIDFASHSTGQNLRIQNSKQGFKDLIKWLEKQKINLYEALVIMEHTGLYGYCLEKFLREKEISFCKVNALEVKRSLGLVRGKSDKVDACRLAEYGLEKLHKLKPESPSTEALDRLKMLRSSRHLLVRQRASLVCSIKEYRNIGLKDSDLVIHSQLKVVKELTKQISLIEKEIEGLIMANENLLKNFQMLTTIVGVGKLTALAVLIKNGNFTRFTDGRKFACYCGTAPFEHSSGTSVKLKNRVSHLADKDMKSHLDLAAKTAIRHDPELKAYYERRVSEGKSKMSTINIVRNKLIYRMFAVVRRQSSYIKLAA